jgi:hypothetical protein
VEMIYLLLSMDLSVMKVQYIKLHSKFAYSLSNEQLSSDSLFSNSTRFQLECNLASM